MHHHYFPFIFAVNNIHLPERLRKKIVQGSFESAKEFCQQFQSWRKLSLNTTILCFKLCYLHSIQYMVKLSLCVPPPPLCSWDFFTYFWKLLGESNTYHFKKWFINKLFFQFIIDVFLLLVRMRVKKWSKIMTKRMPIGRRLLFSLAEKKKNSNQN